MSLPSRERGLKSHVLIIIRIWIDVAPFAGAWIEILHPVSSGETHLVAPFAGAWIEIAHPPFVATAENVAPFAGAWIEISADK